MTVMMMFPMHDKPGDQRARHLLHSQSARGDESVRAHADEIAAVLQTHKRVDSARYES